MGGDQDRTADELQRNQAERGNEAVCALISFVLFVSFVVKQSILHVRFQAARGSTKNVANKGYTNVAERCVLTWERSLRRHGDP